MQHTPAWLTALASIGVLIVIAGCAPVETENAPPQSFQTTDEMPPVPVTEERPSSQSVEILPNRTSEPHRAGDAVSLSAKLATISALWEESPEEAAEYAADQRLRLEDDRVLATVKVTDGTLEEEVRADLLELNSEVHANFETFYDVWIPVQHLRDAAGLPYVEYVTEVAATLPLPDEREDENQ